jgi:ubiquinone/menaquinone biosynthesis C-methylase UbiE
MSSENRDRMASASASGNIREFFDSFAASYGQGRYFELRRAAVFQILAPYLVNAAQILDLGCGNGTYLIELCKLGKLHRPVGMDISQGMLAKAREQLGNGVELVQGDAAAIPFKSNSWDLVICSHVLLFVKELHRCLADIARTLRPGSLLVVTTAPNLFVRLRQMFGDEIFAEFDRVAAGTPVAAEPATSERDYRRACLKAGLRVDAKTAHFELDRASVENSLRAILARFAAPEVVNRTLDSVQAALGSNTHLPLTEPLLFGTKDS